MSSIGTREKFGMVLTSHEPRMIGKLHHLHQIALGIDAAVAQTAVRFTLDGTTTSDQVAEVVERVADAVATVSSLGSSSTA